MNKLSSPDGLPVAFFETPDRWAAWLAKNHRASSGLWLRIAKKTSGLVSQTYAEAVEVALAWGWIDSQLARGDDQTYLQRFTPRKPRSPWSKINRDKALALIRAGKMEPPGLAEVERARGDGRWDAAYDSARTATVPSDLAAALAANKKAAAFFTTLDGANRYAILYRVQTAKKEETRQRRIAELVAMLARHETIHPPAKGVRKK
ncbi:MAG: YdeI/OmpD-associated family protein [Gemmatimonadota bacterium]|nr:YdeI/OmpD-associated family protein [Gemmatimonadota bacterium]